MDIEKFKYKLPILWLDTNVIIDIARAKAGKIVDANVRDRALKIYDTVYKLTREKKVLCIEGEQRDEYGNRVFLSKECDDILTALTLGIHLQHPLVTRQFQIQQMMKVYLGKQEKFTLQENEIFHDDPIDNLEMVDDSGLIIAVRFSIGDELRQEKLRIRDAIYSNLENIRQENLRVGRTFEQQVELENRADIKVVLDFIRDSAIKQSNNEPITVDYLVGNMGRLDPVHWWHYETGKEFDLQWLAQFYLSQYFRNIPHVDIFSKLAAHILTDSKRAIKNSDNMDISQMSILLPYCDYILTDGELKDRIIKLKLNEKYGTKVYSLRDVDSLMNELK